MLTRDRIHYHYPLRYPKLAAIPKTCYQSLSQLTAHNLTACPHAFPASNSTIIVAATAPTRERAGAGWMGGQELVVGRELDVGHELDVGRSRINGGQELRGWRIGAEWMAGRSGSGCRAGARWMAGRS